MKKVLLTGMTGFAGRYLAEKILAETDWEIYSIQRITPRLDVLQSPRIHVIYHDFRASLADWVIQELAGINYIAHMGAEVHGLRSLENPDLFVQSNVLGTFNLLEAARLLTPEKFIYISSAESVGSSTAPVSLEEDCVLRPSNPYSASKGVGEMLCRSYFLSFNVPTVVVRTMNFFGPRQDVSKFIPATIKKIIDGDQVQIHVGKNGIGSRHWLHIKEFSNAVLHLFRNGTTGEIYHVAGPEKTNQEIVFRIAQTLRIPLRQSLVVPGPSHDMRYSIKDTKLSKEAYDSSSETMWADLESTVLTYKQHQEWLR